MLVECTRLPLVPLTMTRYEPAATFFLLSSVSTDVPDVTTELGLNLALTALGRPLAERVTVPVKPASAAIVTLYVAFAPRRIVTLDGAAEIEKSPLTTSVTFTVWLTDPLAPLIASVYVPPGVVPLVDTLRVAEPDPLTDAGVNEAVAPDGRPVTLKLTAPVNPDPAVTVAV
jgi:hypothetical protein